LRCIQPFLKATFGIAIELQTGHLGRDCTVLALIEVISTSTASMEGVALHISPSQLSLEH
jgi:hypothetical protein